LKSQQQWRVSKDNVIVGLPDGSRLKLPSWMATIEAAAFEISDFPTVSLDALMTVYELLEARQVKEIEEFRHYQSTLPRRTSNLKKGNQDETTSALDHSRGIQSNQDRGRRPPRGSRNHGRSNNRRCSSDKGGKR
jgi:hypothetical protein